RVDGAEVAGAEPAVGGERLGVERRVPVAEEALWPAGEDLALASGRDGDPLLVDDLDLDGTDGAPLAVDPAFGRIVGAGGRDGRELGRAVHALGDAAEACGRLAHEGRLDGRAAAGEETQARRVAGGEVRMLRQVAQEGRCAG